MSRLLVNASDLSPDSGTADWLFETAGCDESSDPLAILLQREQEELDDEMISFARNYN